MRVYIVGKSESSDPEVTIKQQPNRKSMVMRITASGVRVFIPDWLSPNDRRVRKFVAEGLRKLQQYDLPERVQYNSDEDIRAMVMDWAEKMDVQPGRIQMREMYSRWGSCSSRTNITLNTALYYVPRELAEYVVVHELVHLCVFDHGPNFQKMMSDYLPDWREREKALREFGL